MGGRGNQLGGPRASLSQGPGASAERREGRVGNRDPRPRWGVRGWGEEARRAVGELSTEMRLSTLSEVGWAGQTLCMCVHVCVSVSVCVCVHAVPGWAQLTEAAGPVPYLPSGHRGHGQTTACVHPNGRVHRSGQRADILTLDPLSLRRRRCKQLHSHLWGLVAVVLYVYGIFFYLQVH